MLRYGNWVRCQKEPIEAIRSAAVRKALEIDIRKTAEAHRLSLPLRCVVFTYDTRPTFGRDVGVGWLHEPWMSEATDEEIVERSGMNTAEVWTIEAKP